MKNEKQKYFIGCSGYYYPQWKGTFYPEKLPASEWLSYYSTIFNTVEFNGSFYRVPKVADMKKQYKNTPPDFKFSVKVNRYITHILRLKNSRAEIEKFQVLIEEGFTDKLHKFLFQMPPSFHNTEENVDLILNNIPEGSDYVIELRHSSWWADQTKELFKERKNVFCNVDYPGLQNNFISTSRDFYLRLHGTPELFKSSYSDKQLKKFISEIPKNRQCTVYFNNTYYDAAFKNALRMKELFSGH